MRHFLSISLLFLLFVSCKDEVELHNLWLKKESSDTFFYYSHTGFYIRDKGFVGLSLHPYLTRSDWWEYNSRNGQWTRNMPYLS